MGLVGRFFDWLKNLNENAKLEASSHRESLKRIEPGPEPSPIIHKTLISQVTPETIHHDENILQKMLAENNLLVQKLYSIKLNMQVIQKTTHSFTIKYHTGPNINLWKREATVAAPYCTSYSKAKSWRKYLISAFEEIESVRKLLQKHLDEEILILQLKEKIVSGLHHDFSKLKAHVSRAADILYGMQHEQGGIEIFMIDSKGKIMNTSFGQIGRVNSSLPKAFVLGVKSLEGQDTIANSRNFNTFMDMFNQTMAAIDNAIIIANQLTKDEKIQIKFLNKTGSIHLHARAKEQLEQMPRAKPKKAV